MSVRFAALALALQSVALTPAFNEAVGPAGSVLCAATPLAPDDGDDDAQYIAGLAEKDLFDLVVREGRAFLKQRANHRRAVLVRYLVADALFELGNFKEARPEFTEVLKATGFEQEREARFRSGQCALELDDAPAAAQAFERVLAGDPGYLAAPATFLLGEAYFRARELDKAEQAYWAVLQLDEPGTYAFDAACAMCWTAKERGALDQVTQRVAACLKAAPEGDARIAELRLLLGEAHYGLGAHAEALAAFRSVPEGDSRAAARRGAGFALSALGRDAEAAAEFEAVLASGPSEVLASEVKLRAGAAWVRAGEFARALPFLRPSTTAEPAYWCGRAQAGLGQHEEALRSYEAALSSQPSEELVASIAGARADSLYALGRTAEAAAVYEKAGGEYALHAAAVARANDGQHAEAARLARALLEQHPDSKYADATRFVLGEALFQLGDLAGARAALAACVAANQDPVRVRGARQRLCWCDFKEGEFARAEGGFAELVKSAPSDDERAEALFMSARSSEERIAAHEPARKVAIDRFTALADRYQSSPRRPEALLRLARLVDGEAGERHLVRLASEHGEHELADDALYDLAERRSARGAHEPALAAYTDLAARAPQGEFAARAAYGRAWCEHALAQHDAAAQRLAALLSNRELEASLRVSATELRVWVEADRGDGRAAEQALRELYALGVDGARGLDAARRTHAALAASGEAPRGVQLLADLAARAKSPADALALRVEEVFARLDAGGAATDPAARKSRFDEAEARARELAKSEPKAASVCEALFFVGEARYGEGDFARAAALYDLAAAGGGDVRERALYKGGFAAVRLEDWAAVETRFAALAAEFGQSALLGESLFLLGEARYRTGKDAAAIEALLRMRKEFPQHELATKALFRLGLAQARLGHHQDAARSLADLVRAAPDFEGRAEAELWRGRALAGLADRRSARAAFAAVLERDKAAFAAQARLELGELARAEGDLDAALSEFLKVAVLYEASDLVADALVRAGSVLEAQGEKTLALDRYREVVREHASSTFAAKAQARIDALTR